MGDPIDGEQMGTLRGIFSLVFIQYICTVCKYICTVCKYIHANACAYLNETCYSYSFPGPHDADDISKVMGSKVKVMNNFFGGSMPIDSSPSKTIWFKTTVCYILHATCYMLSEPSQLDINASGYLLI